MGARRLAKKMAGVEGKNGESGNQGYPFWRKIYTGGAHTEPMTYDTDSPPSAAGDERPHEQEASTPIKAATNNGAVRCPLGKRCRLDGRFARSRLVGCTLEEGETCKQLYDIGGVKYCWIILYPTARHRA